MVVLAEWMKENERGKMARLKMFQVGEILVAGSWVLSEGRRMVAAMNILEKRKIILIKTGKPSETTL